MSARAASDLRLVGRLLVIARRYRRHIVAILLLDLLATPIALLTPVPLKLVVDSVLGSEPLPNFMSTVLPESWLAPSSLLLLSVGLLIGTAALTQIQSLGSTLLRAFTGGRMVLTFRTLLFRHAQRLSLSYHDAKGASDTIYRVQYDTTAIEEVLINGLIPMVAATFTVAAMLYVTARINTQLLLIALLVTPVIVLLTKLYRLPLRRTWKEFKNLDNAAMSVVSEVFSSLRVVKAYSQEQREERRYTNRAHASLDNKLKAFLLQGTLDIGTSLATAAGTAAVLFVGVGTIRSGQMTVGDLLVIMSYLALMYSPLKTIGRRLASLQNAFASADRAFALIDRNPDVPDVPDAVRLTRARGDIEFADVTFGYAASRAVIHNASFSVPAGCKVGIIGKTGAGKTTLLSLLMRFYDPTAGEIRLDGRAIRGYRLADLRRQFALVLQDTILFSTSIRENIAYARPDATDEEIRAAAAAARADQFIEALPNGYETTVGERGMRLSGGERQRIALARAFLRDAPILLLDEPTSALDANTEREILEVMERLMAGRTTFMITHRVDTVAGADVILELSAGRLRSREGTSAEGRSNEHASPALIRHV